MPQPDAIQTVLDTLTNRLTRLDELTRQADTQADMMVFADIIEPQPFDTALQALLLFGEIAALADVIAIHGPSPDMRSKHAADAANMRQEAQKLRTMLNDAIALASTRRPA